MNLFFYYSIVNEIFVTNKRIKIYIEYVKNWR